MKNLTQLISEVENILLCPICLNILEKPLKPKCVHYFCEKCIKMAHRLKKECPVCKEKITGNILYSCPNMNKILQIYKILVQETNEESEFPDIL
ncbi:hypothetical protein CWI38_1269p0040 [Hamiltosporidium tvaerminnensis]|nr:hypothetical protein CWI38_1269p0040 [Hamiltosporidium tvaerminnensis]